MGLTKEQLKQKAFRERKDEQKSSSDADEKQRAFRQRENKRKREWRLRKKLEHSHDGSQVQASSIMRMQEGIRPDELEKQRRKTRPAHISSPQVSTTKQQFRSISMPAKQASKRRPPAPAERTFTETEVRSLLRDALTIKEPAKEPEPPRPSRSERRRMKKLKSLHAQLVALKDEPPEEAKYPLTPDQAVAIQQSHFTGKKPLQFASSTPTSAPVRANPKRRLHWRAKPTPQELFAEAIPQAEAVPPTAPDIPSAMLPPDVVEEQLERPLTTIWCPESIKEDGLADVKRHPELYIEINVVKKSRVVDTFYIDAERRTFFYKKKNCNVKEDAIYLLPTRLGAFMPTTYYKEGDPEPKGFKQTNKGITGKALSLLYMEQLYTSLLYSEDVKYNFFIVILSIACLIAYGIGCYFLFTGAWIAKPPEGGSPVITTILLPWLGRLI